jgi:N-methylhydantoinase A/oxoprolinase/acetone carboxylase beta subunit
MGGALRVGPTSAGADPGPVCYGTGNELTVTDANLLLGRIDPGYFLGGRMTLDVDRAVARARAMASGLGLDDTGLAEGIVRVANANMERAIRVVSVQRGYDPREFALLAFGGAGGMHACDLAAMLDIGTVIVPRHAGVLSALGMLLADVTRDYSRSVLRPVAALAEEDLANAFAPLVDEATHDLRTEGFGDGQIEIHQTLDVRYVGQSYEIAVPNTPAFRAEFDRRHERLYGYGAPHREAEVVTVRVRAVGRTAKPQLPRAPHLVSRLPGPVHVRPVCFGGRWLPSPFFHMDQLGSGMAGHGPAIIAAQDATIVVPPDFHLRVDEVGSVILTHVVRTRERRRHPAGLSRRAA